MSDALQRLEEKIAYLERHVTEQDKVMLGMSDQLERMRRELVALRDRVPPATGMGSEPTELPVERPPHY